MTQAKQFQISSNLSIIYFCNKLILDRIMQHIIFATNNQHKLEEIRHILKDKFKVSGLRDIGYNGDIAETGLTLAENASIKSHFIYEKFGIDCFSDDTGLDVEALDGRPGVYSARYAGEDGNAKNNIRKLLNELEGVENRNASFKTVISLIMNGKEYLFEGKVSGEIIKNELGSTGFGYDPVFVPNGYDHTFAEMSSVLKNKISHRAKAMEKLIRFLNLNDF